MRRPYLPVVVLTVAAAAACGSSGKGTVGSPPASVSVPAATGASSGPALSSPGPSSSAEPSSSAASSGSASSGGESPGAPASANGEAAKPAATVLADAKAALAAAHSVHIKGGGSSDSGQISLDLRLLGSQGGVGTISLKGTVLQLIRNGTQVYVKGDDAFYKQFANAGNKGAAVAQLLHGRWLKSTTANKSLASLADFTDTAVFAKQLTPSGTTAKGAPGSLRGLPTVTLLDSDQSTLVVAASGPPYPLRIASTGSSNDAGTIDFLDYDAPVALTPPPAGETVDIDALKALGSSASPSAGG